MELHGKWYGLSRGEMPWRTASLEPLFLFTWVSHGDWLLFRFIVVDDYCHCIVESSPGDFLFKGTVSPLQQGDPLLDIRRDKEPCLRITA